MSITVLSLAPSIKRLSISQVSGMIVMIITYPIIFLFICFPLVLLISVITAFLTNGGQFLDPISEIISDLVMLFPLGAVPALVQIFFLSQWIKRKSFWVMSNTFATASLLLIMISAWKLFCDWAIPGYVGTPETVKSAFILTSIPFGFIGGVMIGAVQSFWLTSMDRRLWLINGLTWAISSPFLIYIAVSIWADLQHPVLF